MDMKQAANREKRALNRLDTEGWATAHSSALSGTASSRAASAAESAPGTRGRAMKSDLDQLIDRLESLVVQGKHVPLSAMVMVEEHTFIELIDQLRIAFGEEIRDARRVSSEKDRVINHAQGEADKILRTAESEAAKMLAETDVVRVANERAVAIVREAEARASEQRRGAEAYVVEALSGLDEELSRLLAQIRRGRAMLERPRNGGTSAELETEQE
jgi:uncharacterized protein YicC (UPF0701 family)